MVSQNLSGLHIGIVIPTYNRPEKLRRLLDSLANQTEPVGPIAVVSAGRKVAEVVESYRDVLKIHHQHVERGGQILQRNLAVGLLGNSVHYITSFDDDIYVLPDAFEKLVEFLRTNQDRYLGVGFNMTNEAPYVASRLLELLQLQPGAPGKVSRAGINSSLAALKRNIETQWLPGGATCWVNSVLQDNFHRPMATKWAVGEDVLFSYPLAKSGKLSVCSSARVLHEHEKTKDNVATSFFRGASVARWRTYFVRKNHDLSVGLSVYSSLAGGLVGLLRGLAEGPKGGRRLAFSAGLICGGLMSVVHFQPVKF